MAGKSIIRTVENIQVGPNDKPAQDCIIADCGELTGEEYDRAADTVPDATGDPYEDFPEDQKKGEEELATAEVIAIATDLKSRGGDAFKKGDVALALAKYQKAIRYLRECPEPLDSDPPETGAQLDALKIALHSNSALMQIKLTKYDAAEKSASNVLAVSGLKDADKAKALYRRALAHKGLKNEEEAVKDLEAALKAVPTDALIKNELNSMKKAAADRAKKEKAKYSNAFGSI